MPIPRSQVLPYFQASATVISLVTVVLVGLLGCGKDVARDASDSDANGYVCLKCEAKFYTPRDVFIGPKCPKCAEDALVEAVGYVCAADGHLTLCARSRARQGETLCERCKAPVSALRLPREKDLKAWGAIRANE